MKQVEKKEIIEKLKANEMCVLPTDTVYGLMAVASKENEEKLNIIKKRDKDQKISIIFSSVDDALKHIVNLNEEKTEMIKKYLPGKYTFIVNLDKEFCSSKGFDRTDFGIRVTSNDYLQEVLKETGPVLATSCNYTKEDICVSLDDIKRIFKDMDIYVYYTEEGSSTPSSIIDLTKEKINILR